MKIAHKNYKFYSDASHGWLCVSKKKLIKLGIDDKVSEYSYIRKDKVFLEEDTDAPLFLSEMDKRGFKYDIIHVPTSKKSSKIRSYSSYKPLTQKTIECGFGEDEVEEKLVIGNGIAIVMPKDC